MNTIETTTYILPDYWASALINDDATGLSDAEHEQLNEWLLAYKPCHCIGVSDEPEFRHRHDAAMYVDVPACDYLTYTFQQTN